MLCSKNSPNERPTMRDVMLMENLRHDLLKNANASRRLRQLSKQMQQGMMHMC